jgi:hypothetical protein
MVILGVLSLFLLSILWEGEGELQQLEQLYLLPQSNIVPAEATNATANDTRVSSSGNNLTQQEQSPGNDTTAASSTGLRIAYPEGWIANDLGNGTVRISTPYKGDLMRFTVNAVNIPPSLRQNLTLDRLVDVNLNSLKQHLSNFTLLESNKTTISANENQIAYKIVYTNTNKNPNFPLGFKTMQIFAIKDGQAYTISYVSEESQYLRFLPVIERMIDSISFTIRMAATQIIIPPLQQEAIAQNASANTTTANQSEGNQTEGGAATAMGNLTQADFGPILDSLNTVRESLQNNDTTAAYDEVNSAGSELFGLANGQGEQNINSLTQQFKPLQDNIDNIRDALRDNDAAKALQQSSTADDELLKITQQLPSEEQGEEEEE